VRTVLEQTEQWPDCNVKHRFGEQL
jgi:hypothetical protein